VRRRNATALSALLIAALLILSACQGVVGGAPAPAPDEPVSQSDVQYITETSAPVIETVAAVYNPLPMGTGSLVYAENIDRLDAQKEEKILDFMHLYYASLANLAAEDPSPLFAADAGEQAEINRMVWEVMVDIRAMQDSDLRLTVYSFALEVQLITELESGDISVRVHEDFIQNFAAFPGVDSKGFNVAHVFTFTYTDDGWRILNHRQADRLYNTVVGRRNNDSGLLDSTAAQVRQRRDEWLEASGQALRYRSGRGYQPGNISFDNEYDRAAAVDYARRWATAERNPVWQIYDRMGGNCQNFVSQAILAGGVPMDYTPPAQWKWFGDTPSSTFTPTGRAPAWTGVNEFFAYVRGNAGFGMVAFADVPFDSGRPGDVIIMGKHDIWRHTVMITEVITDEQGNTVDYLIASNTANLLDFPVSAYHYQEQMLIRILGWNN